MNDEKKFIAVLIASVVLILGSAIKSHASLIDGFEYEDNRALWDIWKNASWSPSGAFTLSSNNNHTPKGSKSIKVGTNGNRQILYTICKNGKAGSAIFWFYDSIDSTNNSKGACVGLKDVKSKYYWRIGVGGGKDNQMVYQFSDKGNWHKTKVVRKKGWRKFEFSIGKTAGNENQSQVKLFIDGVEIWEHIYKDNKPKIFNTAFIQTTKGNKNLPFYVDDFFTSLKFVVSANNSVEKTKKEKTMKSLKFISSVNPPKWFPFPIPLDDYDTNKSMMDFSFLLDAPAGKHGFVQVKNGHFVFEDGTPARFFGLNIHSAKGLHLSHRESDAVAKDWHHLVVILFVSIQ